MTKHENIEDRLAAIESRNSKVELDKAWETSLTRKATIAVATYLIVSLFMVFTKSPRPFLSALIPVLGYILSTLALPFVRKFWEGAINK
jgi:hypothetical protein